MEIPQDLMEPATKPKKTFDLPTFIPGIIIQGHMWHLIITTPQDRKTMVWQSVCIGTTQSTKGIYQIVYILQLIREGVKSKYWPLIRNIVSAGCPGMPE
jgi:hypothetical protein